ncbi:MAG: 5-(carboxyamino)imidazole ribonucleotide synthase [Gemmatimonadota bacterium]
MTSATNAPSPGKKEASQEAPAPREAMAAHEAAAPHEKAAPHSVGTVGILGGGQLGRMMALAGRPLGFRFHFLEPSPNPPATELGPVIQAAYDDPDALGGLARSSDVVTYEFENVSLEAARILSDVGPFHPAPAALAMAQDRLDEKAGFQSLGIPVAPHAPVETRQQLHDALEALGYPAVLKTRRMGYDGKGQAVLNSQEEVESAWEKLGPRGPLILEGFVSFQRELSQIAVRGRKGEVAFYPLTENIHREGILVESIAPAPRVSSELRDEARGFLRDLLSHLEYVGVLAVEFFETSQGLVANEMAPRVHNSGHWTQDGAECSQFENHVRAVAGLPLGSTEARGPIRMLNLLGEVPEVRRMLRLPGVHLHLYEKSPRPGRKLGHVNVTGASSEQVDERAAEVRELLMEGAAR